MRTFVCNSHLKSNLSTLVLTQRSCASGDPCQVQKLEPAAPVQKQVQKLEQALRQIISAKALQCQVKKFIVEYFCQVLYNCCIPGENR
jgi:hypothetical protein